jgi:hypothetical protein
LAEISLVHGAVLDSFRELGWVRIGSIVFKIWSWSPYSTVLDSGDTVLLKVSNCLISFAGSFTELFNSVAAWYKINSSSDSSLWSGSGRLIA